MVHKDIFSILFFSTVYHAAIVSSAHTYIPKRCFLVVKLQLWLYQNTIGMSTIQTIYYPPSPLSGVDLQCIQDPYSIAISNWLSNKFWNSDNLSRWQNVIILLWMLRIQLAHISQVPQTEFQNQVFIRFLLAFVSTSYCLLLLLLTSLCLLHSFSVRHSSTDKTTQGHIILFLCVAEKRSLLVVVGRFI